MPYIIDGNNLVGSSPDISLDDPEAKAKLLFIVKKFQENKKNNVIVVFDGEPEVYTLDGDTIRPNSKFNIVYPRGPGSADDEIKILLDGFNYFKDVTLVTSDKALKTYARKKGAKTVNSIEFYFELKRFSRVHGKHEERRQRIDAELSDIEVDQWMKIFDE